MDRYPPDDDYEGPEEEFDPRDERYSYSPGWDDYEDFSDDFDYDEDQGHLDPYGDLEPA